MWTSYCCSSSILNIRYWFTKIILCTVQVANDTTALRFTTFVRKLYLSSMFCYTNQSTSRALSFKIINLQFLEHGSVVLCKMTKDFSYT